MKKDLLKAVKNGNVSKFYKSRTWRKKRRQILERDNFECQMCKKEGKVSKGNTVHHIKHLKDFPELGLTDENLITLCYAHHNEVHLEKRGAGKAKAAEIPERW